MPFVHVRLWLPVGLRECLSGRGNMQHSYQNTNSSSHYAISRRCLKWESISAQNCQISCGISQLFISKLYVRILCVCVILLFFLIEIKSHTHFANPDNILLALKLFVGCFGFLFFFFFSKYGWLLLNKWWSGKIWFILHLNTNITPPYLSEAQYQHSMCESHGKCISLSNLPEIP